ncbi:MAG TPA: hypothetical protein VF158_06295 [Longimicrobiales bacterium]
MATRLGTDGWAAPGEGHAHHGFLRHFYAGESVPCHVGCGGAAEVVRVGTAADGGGELWLECGSCAQRVRYFVPRPSAEEREEVMRALDGGGEAVCPRHARRTPLQPKGRQLVCPECGVRYRE